MSVKTHHKVLSDTGNFGITLAGPKEKAGEIGDALTKEFLDLGNVKDDEVARVKNVLKTQFLTYTSDTRRRMKFLSKTALDFGKPMNEQDMIAMLDKTTGD